MFAATIGFFDGVHRGHRCLIDQLMALSAERNLETMIVTMREHPRTVLQSDYIPRLLTTPDEKERLLRETGVNSVYFIPFNRNMASLTAAEFMEQILKPRGIRMLLMGYDHHFGHGKALFEDYVEWGRQCGIEVKRAHELEGLHVSSTAIRSLLVQGKIKDAEELLGHKYLLSGEVIEGHHIGRRIGFPTANIKISTDKVLPCMGVYAVRTEYGLGMLDIGTRPTVNNGNDMTVEVHLINFSGNLYGKSLTLELLTFIREERTFESLDQLQQQLEKDRNVVLSL